LATTTILPPPLRGEADRGAIRADAPASTEEVKVNVGAFDVVGRLSGSSSLWKGWDPALGRDIALQLIRVTDEADAARVRAVAQRTAPLQPHAQ